MAYAYGSLVFTPVIKALQERYGSRRQYARREGTAFAPDPIGPSEVQFLAECDRFYMASVGATGGHTCSTEAATGDFSRSSTSTRLPLRISAAISNTSQPET
jgi:hypothetical protein